MRVLWLTNTCVGASEHLNVKKATGGWMSSLEANLKKVGDVKLGVCFFYDESNEFKFELETVTYYPVKTKNSSFLGKIKSVLSKRLEDSNVKHLRKVIEDYKPDVIQLFGTESGLGEVLREVDTPHIIHIQGLINPCLEAWFPKGMCQKTISSHSSLKDRILKTGFIGEYYKFQKMAVREKKILSNAKNIFGRTKWDKNIVSLYNSEANYYHCDELLRAEFFENEWTSNSIKELKICSTINPNIYKGLEIILKTANLLKNEVNLNFKWTIIGMEASSPLVKIIEGIIGKKFNGNNTFFAGYLNPDDLIDTLLASNIFVHPSHIDNSPNSVCEAMLLGMPVIAGNVGGVSSIIENGFNGLLYNSHDSFELATLLLSNAKEDLTKLGKNARNTALKRHDSTTITKTILETYQSLIANRKIS